MTELLGDGFRLRPAREDDVAALVALAARPEIADFLAAVSPWEEQTLRAAIAGDADDVRLVIEAATHALSSMAGALGWEVANQRSRIAHIHGVMVDPAFRGRGLAERACRLLAVHLIREQRFHRVQVEVYGFNERARRLFARAGFTEEGVRRRAYWRHGGWVDGVLYGLLADDLDEQPP